MSAPTPAPGDEIPREGYYPDPSIPGYVRYWNGASWVPGTSRPAPRQAGPAAAPAAGARTGRVAESGPVEETGPIFFDEEEGLSDAPDAPDAPEAPAGPGQPVGGHAGQADAASVWQADSARQSGFGGERDRRVEWGGPAQEQVGPPSPPADPRAPLSQGPAGGVLPGARDGGGPAEEAGARPPTEGTVTIRAVGPRPDAARGSAPSPHAAPPAAVQSAAAQPDPAPSNARTPQGPQAMGARHGSAQNSLASAPAARALPAPARQQPQPHQPHQPHRMPQPQASTSVPAPAPVPAQEGRQGPVQAPAATPSPAPVPPVAPHVPRTPGPGGGSASWAEQVHQLAQPEPRQHQPQQQPHQQRQPFQHQAPEAGPQADQPVVPWKPPVDDHFQQLARNQTSARPAGLGKRFAARLVDSLVLGAAVAAAAFPLATRALDHIDRKITAAKETGQTVTVWLLDSTTGAMLGALLAAFLLLGFLLEALPTAKWGRTLGKKLCGLDVRDIESHDAPTLGAALRRWLVYGVLGLLVIGVVNVLWCLVDRPWRQCWHDKAARTFVAG
ncbi:RDD family protein [Streptomyces sp. NPDC091649]|uniref:RDD family protein n=1 Tax=Streptomyces sp. NPDC091649 TaxID=3366004 RepID=UPI00381B21DE